MSDVAMRWAWQQDVAGGAKLLLLALAWRADIYGITFIGRGAASAMCGFSPKSVTENMKRLKADDYVECFQRRRKNGSRTSDWIVLAPGWTDRGEMEAHPSEELPLGVQIATGWAPDRWSGEESSPNDSSPGQVKKVGGPDKTEEKTEKASPPPPPAAREGWTGVPGEMLRQADALLASKPRVSSRLVTEREMMLAAVALAEFNRQMESAFELGPWHGIIVARVREHPTWDAAAHARLVQSAWRIRWWEKGGQRRRANPRVIWSNMGVFENVVQDAADEAAGRRVKVEPPRDRRFFGGRRWEELTPAEQINARDLMSRGIDPATVEREESVPLNGNGKLVTSENIMEDSW